MLKEHRVLKDFRELKGLQQDILGHKVLRVLKEPKVLKERFKDILVSKVLKVLKVPLVLLRPLLVQTVPKER